MNNNIIIKRILILSFIVLVSAIESARADYDYEGLSTRTDLDELINDFYALRTNALAVPEDEKRPDLYREAQYWTSQNVALRSRFKSFVRDTPHTVQTVGDRITTIDIAGCLTAEWAVRLLFEEIMIDREKQESAGYEGLETEEAIKRLITSGEYERLFRRNDHMAAQKIFLMKLKGAPTTVGLGFSPAQFQDLQGWYQQNKHRLDEVVSETWGDHAVLDKDFPPDAQTSEENKSKVSADQRILKAKFKKSAGDKEDVAAGNILKRNWPVVLGVLVALSGILAFFKLKDRKDLNTR